MSFSEKVFIDKSLKGLTTFVIPTQIKDVVTISGSLKGGEYHAKSYNSKIASLSPPSTANELSSLTVPS